MRVGWQRPQQMGRTLLLRDIHIQIAAITMAHTVSVPMRDHATSRHAPLMRLRRPTSDDWLTSPR